MRYRQLGRSGLTVSVIGLGCNNFGWRLDKSRSAPVILTALDSGITLFDTADSYGNKGGSETILGEVLKARRDDVVLATKFGSDMGQGPGVARGSRWYIRRAVEASLRRLQTDHIDLYQLHRPDGITPIAETLGALDELIHEGKVRYVGSSNLEAWQVVEAAWTSRIEHRQPFISAQNHYNLLERKVEADLLPACAEYGVGVLPFFPLANGLLTGKYQRGPEAERPTGTRLEGRDISDETFDRLTALEGFAKARGRSLLELAFAGLLAHRPVASVIAGATSPAQVEANVACGDWDLDEAEVAELDRL